MTTHITHLKNTQVVAIKKFLCTGISSDRKSSLITEITSAAFQVASKIVLQAQLQDARKQYPYWFWRLIGTSEKIRKKKKKI